MSFQRT